MNRTLNGNAATSHTQGDRSSVTSTMSAKMSSALPRDISPMPHSRPPIQSHHSSSMPSTPYQQPRELSFHRRSPSPAGINMNTSPRSTHSESGHFMPSARKPFGGCKYETGMAFSKRRVPYTLGTEKLEAEKNSLKAHLEPEEDDKLSGDMRELYDRLFPSPESETQRKKLLEKLENILNAQWPGHAIKVNVFGSTGNNLSTNDSDVDICITTDFKELEHVCTLAELLANRGMERVVCVSSAKVPIVKIWDPELQLACDMNVNNPMALENTRMIKTYVQIDQRVRPLAMVVKYWAKRRILNDAALGGTLSSYTWICMIIHFLQNRDPPILPALQQRSGLKKAKVDGLDVSFDDDLESLRGFGSKNKESLGELLFQFFRYYGHEIDYEKNVISVRLGKLIPKTDKGWHRLQDNRLCVEEPFNISRNLGNTADDTSVRGIHLELRRAFDLLSEGNLEKCCEQYEYPTEEGRIFERPPQSKPVQVHAAPQSGRGGRGGGSGGRGGRGYNNRGGSNTGRRASSASTRGPNPRWSSYGVTPQEMTLQAQQQQYMLHDHLFQQFQLLQQQEQELRMQLQQQAMQQPGRLLLYPHLQFPQPPHDGLHNENHRARAGTVNHPPLTAPIRPQGFGYSSLMPMPMPLAQGRNTNPPSPSLGSAIPERHSFRRSSAANGTTGGSLRAQSQPARPMSSQAPVQNPPPDFGELQSARGHAIAQTRRTSHSPPKAERDVDASYFPANSRQPFPHSAFDHRPSEYIGYYVGGSPSLQPYPQSAFASPLLGPSGLAVRNGPISPYLAPNRLGYGSPTISPPPEPSEMIAKTTLAGDDTTPPAQEREPIQAPLVRDPGGPLIVDGSHLSEESTQTSRLLTDSAMTMSLSTSTSEDAFTPTTSDTTSQDLPDNLPLEPEYPGTFAQQMSEVSSQHSPSGRDALGILHSQSPGKHAQRISSIPARLSIQTPNGEIANGVEAASKEQAKATPTEKSSSPNGETDFSRPKGSSLDAKQSPAKSPGSILSPVKEVRTPSPTSKRRSLVIETERPNGATNRPKAKAKPERQVTAESPADDRPRAKPEPLATKPNGTATGQPMSTAPNGLSTHSSWQTQQKKKKHQRNVSRAANDAGQMGHAVPLDESQRKGG